MNYQKHYDRLIERARVRPKPEGYCEKHHVVPRCLGGSDENNNLVLLTAEEHYVAHQLLVKLNPAHAKLIFASYGMTVDKYGHRSCNKAYGWVKKTFYSTFSKHMKELWANEEYRSKMLEFYRDEVRNSKISEAKKKLWKNPEYYWNNLERREAQSQFMKTYYDGNAEVKKLISDTVSAGWKNKDSKYNSKEYRNAIAVSFNRKYRCECGFESNIGNIKQHQKRTSHSVFTSLEK